ncbi:pentapeptide repeat-containing protein [Methanoculleus sp.]|uniref:pentapeptide repeat-containing protein n=1 Tax=Methanoculleus sp. TaxID=90427 RepID=UPI0025D33687|nr:pentapeptide repeat-containing protein [Methanoculleus sp.]MCK9319736.1 pentapeptide repeat-containing protein [Methanoculleus sp.]
MEQSKLNKILELHRKWLNNEKGGEKANLCDTNLRDANLLGADLRYANLLGAYLRDANLSGADLRDANLRDANLLGAYLRDANLSGADLRDAYLRDANLSGADLRGADLDFSTLPLWCGGLNFTIDERLAKQLVYHVVNLMQTSNLDVNKIFKKQVYKWLEDSHVVIEHGLPKLEEK